MRRTKHTLRMGFRLTAVATAVALGSLAVSGAVSPSQAEASAPAHAQEVWCTYEVTNAGGTWIRSAPRDSGKPIEHKSKGALVTGTQALHGDNYRKAGTGKYVKASHLSGPIGQCMA